MTKETGGQREAAIERHDTQTPPIDRIFPIELFLSCIQLVWRFACIHLKQWLHIKRSVSAEERVRAQEVHSDRGRQLPEQCTSLFIFWRRRRRRRLQRCRRQLESCLFLFCSAAACLLAPLRRASAGACLTSGRECSRSSKGRWNCARDRYTRPGTEWQSITTSSIGDLPRKIYRPAGSHWPTIVW